MSLSLFEMHSVELRCQRPPGACYIICDEWHYKACLRKAADLEKAKADTREFLGIAGPNRTEWERDRNLLRSLLRRHWLMFHRVDERNPDTDGWWIIGALLSEVRSGSLLAVKGRRAELFAPDGYTPLRSLVSRAVSLPNTPQPRSIAARAAMPGGSGDGDLAGNGGASTLLGDARPFEYRSDIPDGDAFDIAKTPNDGVPGTWYTNPGSGQMRLFGDDGKPVVDLDFDHFHNGMKPHAHNWNGGARDGGDLVVPFSPWNP